MTIEDSLSLNPNRCHYSLTTHLTSTLCFDDFFQIAYFLSTDPASGQDPVQPIPVVPIMVPPQAPQIP